MYTEVRTGLRGSDRIEKTEREVGRASNEQKKKEWTEIKEEK